MIKKEMLLVKGLGEYQVLFYGIMIMKLMSTR